MTHIANCIRWDAGKPNVYISQETSSLDMNPLSLRNLQASKQSQESIRSLEKSPTIVSPQSHASVSRYQFWPVPPSNSPVGLIRPSGSAEKLSALSMGRAPTPLSDSVVPQDSVPFWQRSGSLARRRKVSVPELGGTMTTVQEMAIDSPTIPGRPALRKLASEAVFGHERSSSAPVPAWRAGPFGGALMACVTGPAYGAPEQDTSPGSTEHSNDFKLQLLPSIGMPLSPILSPSVNSRPLLKVDTTSIQEGVELPPQVPPKSPSLDRRGSPAPLIIDRKQSKTQLITPASVTFTSGGTTPLSAMESRRSPNVHNALTTPFSAISNPFSARSPSRAFERHGSPKIEKRDPMSTSTHHRNQSDTSVMDRGRPVRRTSKRQRSQTCSEANVLETPVQDTWKLPRGMRIQEASMRMNENDKETLHKQAHDQVEKFEVLNKRDVATMSRELRGLDERCDYLRRTYKSLRSGRQKLHGRMISYLKRGETVIFSRESLLKQEEALAELDISIDEFIQKLEQAENRRLRLRQKLLEHVAAALFLNPVGSNGAITRREDQQMAESTPPRSPVKAESFSPLKAESYSPARMERRDVESIKIYADGHVLNLFSDIEVAIGQMCEQAC